MVSPYDVSDKNVNFIKKNSDTGPFLWILRNFLKMLLLEKTTFVIFVLNELQKVFSMFVNVQKVNTILKRVIECPVIESACNKV